MQTTNTEPTNADITSGENLSVWLVPGKQIVFEKLSENVDTDVLVVGGGIAGLTAAYCLAKEGRRVVLVEDGFIGSGETGRTTGHLTCALDDRYCDLENTFDEQRAKLAADSHVAAIEWVAKTVTLHKIACQFRRVDGYLFSHPSDKQENLDKEYEATQRAGLNTKMLTAIPSIAGEDNKGCIQFSNQAQFHVLQYLKGLADAFIEAGGKIYTETKAENITKEGADANGFNIKANHIIVATNTPINDWVAIHTKQWPYRSYVIGARIPKGTLPYALWWDTGDEASRWISKPYHYVRLTEYDKHSDMLLAGGEDHRTGQADDEQIDEQDRYAKLEVWTRAHFPAIAEIDLKWSGQVMEPVDSLAFIGKNPGNENIYIITGDSGNGITHGTLGGMIISDIITGKDNPWIELYSPSRVTLKTAGSYLHEVGNMVAQFSDWLTPEVIKEVENLKPGEGGIVASGLTKIAVYRDEDNNLHGHTAVCPHLGGILRWNADEKTFDCPLHGSRFTTEDKVINGPAITDLKQIETEEELEGEKV